MYKICLTLASLCSLFIFINASSGPGQNFGSGYTNAPFDAGYCNGCHGGGSFTPSVSFQLLNGTTPVSNYTPGASYTLHLNVASSTGVSASTAYGFQVVAVRSSNNLNAGSWGSLAATDYHSVTINGRDYVEHNFPLPAGSIDIPWTAPGPGSGAVTFYAAGNVVNSDEGPTGDNPAANSFTVAVNPLAATWLSFDAKTENSQVLLKWVTTSETNTGFFVLERGSDNKSFSEIYRVNAQKSNDEKLTYNYIDKHPLANNFYRIKHIDPKGQEDYFKTIQVKTKDFNPNIVFIKDGHVHVQFHADRPQNSTVSMYSLDGRIVRSVPIDVKDGHNMITIDKPEQPGLYMIYIKNNNDLLYSEKILVE